jgi:Stigma-specific protein, Stig1/Putative metal-binding motif
VKLRASCWVILSCICAACAFQDERDHCMEARDCGVNQRCYKGFCIERESDGDSSEAGKSGSSGLAGRGSMSSPNTAAGSRSDDAGKGGTGGRPSNSADGGAVDSGNSSCRDGDEQPCLVDPSNATTSEGCNRGMQRCSGGEWGACMGEPMPDNEQCNGLDDDCDQKVDEGQLDQVCYPQGQSGCTQNASGVWTCEGVCALGKATCSSGQYGECKGFKTPAAEEACTTSGMLAADENCNGKTDESCACTPGETHNCYNGLSGTLNVGKCVAGTQTCANGVLGACMNAVIPSNEACDNPGVDDNCDGMMDNIINLGAACVVAGASGPCSTGTLQCAPGKAELTCVATKTPAPETCNKQDDDCNGKVDDTFNLQTDINNCGACGVVCRSGESCCGGTCAKTQNDTNNCGMCGMKCPAGNTCAGGNCKAPPMGGSPAAGSPAAGTGGSGGTGATGGAGSAGMAGSPVMPTCQPACTGGAICCGTTCVNPATDVNNCGACGNVCTNGVRPGCCDGNCVDLVGNQNCGRCGKTCGAVGITCMCTMDTNGAISCTGPVLNLCL